MAKYLHIPPQIVQHISTPVIERDYSYNQILNTTDNTFLNFQYKEKCFNYLCILGMLSKETAS